MSAPPRANLGWTFVVNDKTGRWTLVPRGHAWLTIIVFVLLATIPVLTAILTCILFRARFYAVKVNKYGVKAVEDKFRDDEKEGRLASGQKVIGWPEDTNKRRKMIIATLEYEILGACRSSSLPSSRPADPLPRSADWKIKVKIGGLGVMSSAWLLLCHLCSCCLRLTVPVPHRPPLDHLNQSSWELP